MTADFKRVLIANRGEIALRVARACRRGRTVVEAMKMENPVRAPHAGQVTGLRVGAGETVAQGTPFCRVRPVGDPDHGR